MRKYDGEEIKICNEEETQDFFAMKMQDYQDFEDCTILRNRDLEKMYCFDKREQSVSMETQAADEFAEYLKENYGIILRSSHYRIDKRQTVYGEDYYCINRDFCFSYKCIYCMTE
ncbi:hypothetical protein FMM74_018510 [Lachnospiraceae bacterium MD308]|nr:hypothetical protein [Lachnospiraceae bacterium MD308]